MLGAEKAFCEIVREIFNAKYVLQMDALRQLYQAKQNKFASSQPHNPLMYKHMNHLFGQMFNPPLTSFKPMQFDSNHRFSRPHIPSPHTGSSSSLSSPEPVSSPTGTFYKNFGSQF